MNVRLVAGANVVAGDSGTAVDYDGDGFLDLPVATGASMGRSLGLPSERGGWLRTITRKM